MRILLLLLCAGSAFADDDAPEKSQARVLLSQGNALFERGDLRGALADFRAAYALYPSPKLLVNCAAAERELGDLAAAANDLRHYLDDAADDNLQLAERARIDLKVLERRLGRVVLGGWPARSTIEVDGRLARDSTYVKPGEHHVRARAPGGESLDRDIEVAAGELIELPMVARSLTVPVVPRKPPEKPRSKAWVAAVVVAAVIVVGGAIGLGVALGAQPAPETLKGALGTFKFSDFH